MPKFTSESRAQYLPFYLLRPLSPHGADIEENRREQEQESYQCFLVLVAAEVLDHMYLHLPSEGKLFVMSGSHYLDKIDTQQSATSSNLLAQ